MKTLEELRLDLQVAQAELRSAIKGIEDANTPEDLEARKGDFDAAELRVKGVESDIELRGRIEAATKAAPAPDVRSSIEVTKNESVYRPDNGTSFFRDLVNARSDRDAQERLYSHRAEMRDLGYDQDTGGADFMPPVWLGADYAEKARPGRPFANAIGSRPLPSNSGMTLTFPKISTGASVAGQGSANAAVSETDATTESVDVPVRLIAGQQDMDLAQFERAPNFDQVVFADLVSAYDSKVDDYMLNGGGTAGQFRGIHNVSGLGTVSYNAGTADLAGMTGAIYKGISEVYSNRYQAPTHIIMHPRRAAWLAAQGATAVPVFQPGNLTSAYGSQDLGVVNFFSGIPVIVDANVTTTDNSTQDVIYVVYANDLLLYEGGLRFKVYDEVLSGNAAVRLQVNGYAAFASARQPKGIARVSGTALATVL